MRYQRRTESSGSRQLARRGAGALLCALATAALLIPASASAANSSPGLSKVGETMIQALGGTQAERALQAIGHALVLSEAQEQIAEKERALAAEETAEEEAAVEEAAAPELELNANGEVKNPDE